MAKPDTVPTPDRSPQSVRTPSVVASCPICKHPLQGRQTVCSAKCRIARSRQRREAKQVDERAKVRLFLTNVIENAQKARHLLEESRS
jgi:predicted nucleic acid-binding Zn ribbon protein